MLYIKNILEFLCFTSKGHLASNGVLGLASLIDRGSRHKTLTTWQTKTDFLSVKILFFWWKDTPFIRLPDWIG